MYSILLVDDENIELQTLTEYMPWTEMDIQVIGTAKNGREALKLTERLSPDIILTDVRMPIMDGLEFSRRAKRLNKGIQIVFLSGHNEFQYIKAALAIEASGYLLKPIDTEELASVMEKVKIKCDEAKLTARTEEMAREKLLRSLLLEEVPDMRALLARRYFNLERGFELRGNYRIAFIRADRPETEVGICVGTSIAESLERSVNEAIRSRIHALGFIGELMDWEYGMLAALYPSSLFDGDREHWHSLQKLMAEDFPLLLTIGVSCSGHRLEDASERFKEARQAAEHSFYYGGGAYLPADEIAEFSIGEIEVESYRDRICRAVGHFKSEEAEAVVAGFFTDIRERYLHPHLARIAAVRLVISVERHFAAILKEQPDVTFTSEWTIMNDGATLREIEAHVQQVICYLILKMSEKGKNRHSDVVRQIDEIIDRSFSELLTVEDIAKEVFLSPNYIRSIYKEKTGRTILEALTARRIQEAIRLLGDRSLKVHEIAVRVGYENVSYFCSVFQRAMGMTPNLYRKQIC